MKKKLFLHIGVHKTGSTSVQHFFHSNEQALLQAGILYPRQARADSGHHPLAWSTGMGLGRPAAPDKIATWIAELTAVATASTDIHTVVMSSEEFEYAKNLQALSPLREHFDVTVVVYLRRQDHYLESAYNQHVRMYRQRFAGSVYQFALQNNPFHRYNYRRILAPWEQMFGRDRILVRPYGTALVDPDVRADLLQQIGAEDVIPLLAASNPHSDNISLGANALPYLARINELALTAEQHREVIAELDRRIAPVANPRLLSETEAAEFYQKFSNGNRYVFAHFMGLTEDPFAAAVDSGEAVTRINHDDIDKALLLDVLCRLQLAPGLTSVLLPRRTQATGSGGRPWHD